MLWTMQLPEFCQVIMDYPLVIEGLSSTDNKTQEMMFCHASFENMKFECRLCSWWALLLICMSRLWQGQDKWRGRELRGWTCACLIWGFTLAPCSGIYRREQGGHRTTTWGVVRPPSPSLTIHLWHLYLSKKPLAFMFLDSNMSRYSKGARC